MFTTFLFRQSVVSPRRSGPGRNRGTETISSCSTSKQGRQEGFSSPAEVRAILRDPHHPHGPHQRHTPFEQHPLSSSMDSTRGASLTSSRSSSYGSANTDGISVNGNTRRPQSSSSSGSTNKEGSTPAQQQQSGVASAAAPASNVKTPYQIHVEQYVRNLWSFYQATAAMIQSQRGALLAEAQQYTENGGSSGGSSSYSSALQNRANLKSWDNWRRRRGRIHFAALMPIMIVPFFLMEDWVDHEQARQTRAVLREARMRSSKLKNVDLCRD